MRSTDRFLSWLPISKSDSCNVCGPIETAKIFGGTLNPVINLLHFANIGLVRYNLTRFSKALI